MQKEPYETAKSMHIKTKYVVAAYNMHLMCQRIKDGVCVAEVENANDVDGMLVQLWKMGINKNDVTFI